ncbi:hypothetical protein [Halorussus halophilus]|uniref:hypothetical protein n=1 Tax=Halorussus halophilus TaxID=2650975 RepID=UPI001301851A|nr:hypothetical protein [Halorussus halophilus]
MSGGTEAEFEEETDDQGVVRRTRNAVLAWTLVVCLAVTAVWSGVEGDLLWAGLGAATIAIAVQPAVAYRLPAAMLPWEILLFVTAPYVGYTFLGVPRPLATFLVVSALALAVAVELDAFTPVEMSPGFAVLFTVTTTMAAAGTWAVVQWVVDFSFGTQTLWSLNAVMWSLAAATAMGFLTGGLFAAYFRRIDVTRLGFRIGETPERESRPETPRESSSRRFGFSERRQRQVVRGFQLALVVVLLYGLVNLNVGLLVNAGIALAIMELPAVLERDYDLPIDTGLTLWIVIPVFLHAIGSVGLYDVFGLWDNLTHALSSSLVAAAGYATVRALDVHYGDVYLPPKFVAVYILVFTLAFGVLWELLEFGLDGLASWTGTDSVLAQVSLANTMSDLVFDTVGGLLVAVWGAAHLTRVSNALAKRMATEGQSE